MSVQDTLNLALRHQRAGRLAEAEAGYREVLARQPDAAAALYNLSLVLNGRQKWGEAIGWAKRLVALHPDSVEARHALGTSLYCTGQFDDAEAVLRKALALKPDNGQTHVHLGNVRYAQGHYESAAAEFRRAIAVTAKDSIAHVNLAAALLKLDDLDGAIKASRMALALRPDYAQAQDMLGFSLYSQGRLAEAEAAYRRALELDATFAATHWNLGSLLLLRGDYEQGWPEYEWRGKAAELGLPKPAAGVPVWGGGDLGGKTLLLLAEQGMGDAMQFVRYAPELARRGARVIVACQAPLVRLLSKVEGVACAVNGNERVPGADVQCPMPSLPGKMKTTVATIPRQTPYLFAEPELSQAWGRRMEGKSGRKVGVVWAGRAEHWNDRWRSIPLSQLAPLGAVSGVEFFSLQKGPAARQAKAGTLVMVDWTDELKDFADTAALVANLDLIITADTAVAHLAGGMGKATWVMLPLVPDWRWMVDRADSPWYPTMRLFRQTVKGDWGAVVEEVKRVLSAESL